MKRTIATVVTAAILLAGGAATAEAKSKPSTSGVKVCATALKWSDSVHSESRADRAVQICALTVTTKAQGKTLDKWAKRQSAWIRDLVG
jgi:primosomal replication protein N